MLRRWRRTPARWTAAVSPIIASLLLIGITVAAGAILWTFRVQTPSATVQVEYAAEGDQTEPAWGDPTDCTNETIYASCQGIPAFFLIFTAHSPEAILLTELKFELVCNGTSLLNGTFSQMEVVPGTGANPGSGSPTLGKCGTWKPSATGTTATYFNRLAYFQQIDDRALTLHDGDFFVVYEHPTLNWCDPEGYCDDDYHGAPPWCFTKAAACTIILSYIGSPSEILGEFPLLEIGTEGE